MKGIKSNAMMPANRVGLPRKFIAELKKDLGKCSAAETDDAVAAAAAAVHDGDAGEQDEEGRPKRRKKQKCSHGPDEPDCQKYCWAVLHKGKYELVLFQDSRLIIMYGNAFSSTRCGLIGRGSH